MKRAMGAASALAIAAVLNPAPAAADAEQLAAACGACHSEVEGGGLSRISGQRKSPEGWMMTINRMNLIHAAGIAPETRNALVVYLSDTQGLAPAETAAYRYALEKNPSTIESFEEPLKSMCARCHTGARAMLQARTPEEWTTLIDFHVGQFPTVEYQALGRDRDWYKIAREEIAPMLAESHPLETEAWTAWSGADHKPVAGDWVVLTDLPGKGQAYGRLSVTGEASPYQVTGEMKLADGTALPVKGTMNLYTGYEWRANLTVGDTPMRQVIALSEDGARLEGRQFVHAHDSLGGRITGARADGPATVLGAVPEAAKGLSAPVQLVGVGLDGATAEGGALGGLAANAFGATATVSAEAPGLVQVSAGGTGAAIGLFDRIDSLTVEPAFTIARIGGEGAPAITPAGFRAVAWWAGPDAQPGTEDDIRIGQVPATWSVDNLHEVAAKMEDTRWAGTMAADGVFTPAVAGPNPERPFSTNNAGELTVKAEAEGASGAGTMIVTVQRFIDTPIR